MSSRGAWDDGWMTASRGGCAHDWERIYSRETERRGDPIVKRWRCTGCGRHRMESSYCIPVGDRAAGG